MLGIPLDEKVSRSSSSRFRNAASISSLEIKRSAGTAERCEGADSSPLRVDDATEGCCCWWCWLDPSWPCCCGCPSSCCCSWLASRSLMQVVGALLSRFRPTPAPHHQTMMEERRR